jgi:hypothetical protein
VGGAKIVPGAAEALVDEDGYRRGSCLLERAGQHCRLRAGSQISRRRRTSFDLGDRAEARPAQRVRKASH